MSNPKTITLASAGFESARHVDLLPVGHRCCALHGHSFTATVFANLPADFAPYPGGETDALRERLENCVSQLDYSYLNDTLEQPTDENLARWIGRNIGVPGIQRIAIQSTGTQGVDLDRKDNAHLWRRFRFQAAHQLPNVPSGHKCGRMHGHGFEVILHANQDLCSSDIGIDYDYLEAIWAPFQAQLNFNCLNEIDGLSNPTSENLADWIWTRIKPIFPELSWVTVFETGSCGANFDGKHYRIWKEFTLDSAVRYSRAPENNPRSQRHGHTYTLRLHLEAPLDTVKGWTIDFGDVKEIFNPIFKSIDHQPLYELQGLVDCDVASVADWIFSHAKSQLPSLYRVDLHETPGNGCSVSEVEGGPAMPV
ncbi:6-pyruvoyl tetrahydropterin synthase [Candidatus Kaiserbacteria bacterium]|nr:6-pyruvoyl tetrahydropterin synthase [Candidatus Kaiserbacteria bacterium]